MWLKVHLNFFPKNLSYVREDQGWNMNMMGDYFIAIQSKGKGNTV